MSEISNRINNYIEKQYRKLPAKEYFCKICGKVHKINSSIGEAHYAGLNTPIIKKGSAIRFKNPEEAEAYGVKLPPEFKKPKSESVKKPKEFIKPTAKLSKPKSSISKPQGIMEEVGRQLTPKGPGYQSPEDLVQDFKEAQKAYKKVKGLGQ